MSDDGGPGPFGLPETAPVFPLSGVLLLPDAKLPLNIFEPRYLNMVEDALGQGRTIGILQPRADGVESPAGQPPIYDIGCLGRIVSFAETGDGRFIITLLGLTRFRVAEELPVHRGYRRARLDYGGFEVDLDDDHDALDDRPRLMEAVEAYFSQAGIDADWSTIEDADDTALVTSLSMLCPFEAGEKQALLECADTRSRGAMLIDLMILAMHGDGASTTVRH
ncbi:MAG: LON peptidase substrate-binding domain-containing protein [Rhodospirillales bacterium]